MHVFNVVPVPKYALVLVNPSIKYIEDLRESLKNPSLWLCWYDSAITRSDKSE